MVLEGEIVDAAETFTTPLREKPYAVLNAWGAEKGKRINSGERRSWIETTAGVDATSFVVEDGSGRFRVEPPTFTRTGFGTPVTRGVTNGDFHCEVSIFGTRSVVEEDEHEPPEVRRLLDEHPSASGGRLHAYRYKDGTISVGDSVTVLGHATPTDEEGVNGVVSSRGEGRPLVVADQDLDSLTSRTKASKSVAAAGLLLAILGGALWGLV